MAILCEYEKRARNFERYLHERMAQEARAEVRRALGLVTITVTPPVVLRRRLRVERDRRPAASFPQRAALSHLN